MSKRNFYKGKHFIVFYDKEDETLLHSFDNVKEILEFQKKDVNRTNIRLVDVELYRALKSEEHFVTFLTGEVMRVYIVDMNDES